MAVLAIHIQRNMYNAGIMIFEIAVVNNALNTTVPEYIAEDKVIPP